METDCDFQKWAPVVFAVASAGAAVIAAFNVWLLNKNTPRTRALDLLMMKESTPAGKTVSENA
jgi:hypothetical protein